MAKSTAPSTRRRTAGEGSVYRNGDRWRGAITWTDPDGSRHRRTVSGATSEEARDQLDRLRDRLRVGTLERAGSGSVAEYLTGWIERHRTRVRPSTWKGNESHVRVYLIPSLGRIALAKLTAADVDRALASFMRAGRPVTTSKRGRQKPAPVSPMTAIHIRSTLRRALGDAHKAGMVGRNAAADTTPPYAPARDVTYLEASEVRRLLDASREDEPGSLFAVAVSTGLRLGELLGLSWADIDLARKSVTVRHTWALDSAGGRSLAAPKSSKSRRTLPLPAIAIAALDRQMARQAVAKLAAGSAWQDRRGFVFTDELGRPLTPGAVDNAYRRARARAAIPPVTFHTLRHTAATLMLAEGVPLAVISEWLGHSGIAITAKHYAAIVPQLRQDAADAMDRALAGGAS